MHVYDAFVHIIALVYGDSTHLSPVRCSVGSSDHLCGSRDVALEVYRHTIRTHESGGSPRQSDLLTQCLQVLLKSVASGSLEIPRESSLHSDDRLIVLVYGGL